jgi:hypothetical protein
MFKEKTSKKRLHIHDNNKDISTLDAMHNKIIKDYSDKLILKNNYNNDINDIILKKNIINEEILTLYKLDNRLLDNHYDTLWSCNIKLQEDLLKINQNIKDLDNFNEIEYYEKTSDILFNYYDMLEKQSKIDNKINFSNKTVLDALNTIDDDNKCDYYNNVENEEENIIADKSSLVDKYLSITNKQHIKKIYHEDAEICKKCNKQLICLQHDAIMICDTCGYQELLLVEQNRPILKQNTKDTSHFSYKRINHFREWCNQVQGKESTDIPDEIFEKILNEIKKEKIYDTKTITYTKMREILKRLRINKYYEHINYIINRINGIPTPQFSPDLEDKLCSMFRDIQGPFLKHCPKDRKNFLSYSYVLYKFFQILGLNEYLKYFPLLKSREKLYVQDQIWKKICEELNYEIIPSL